IRHAPLMSRTASPSDHTAVRGCGVLRLMPSEGSLSGSQYFIAPATRHSARQIFIARCASRTPRCESWSEYHLSRRSKVAELGGKSPKKSQMERRHIASHSWRVFGALRFHVSVARNFSNASPSDPLGHRCPATPL